MAKPKAKTTGRYSQREVAVATAPALQHRDITTRELSVRANSYNAETRSFEAVVATETPAEVMDWRTWETVDEILVAEGGEFPERCPLLDSHNRWTSRDVIGSARNFRREGREWVGRGYFAADDPDVERIASRVRDGHITDVSIGYEVLASVDIPARTTQEINGRPFTAGERTLRITTRWRVRELSTTPIGADAQAKIRDHSRRVAPNYRSSAMNPRLLAYIRSLIRNPQATEEEARAAITQLSGVERSIANLLDYNVTDQSSRTSADLAIRSLGFDPENPTLSRRQEDEEDEEREFDDEEEEERADGEEEEEKPRKKRKKRKLSPQQLEARGARREQERQTSLREMAGDLVPAEMLQRAITEGWNTERASTAFLQAIRDGRNANGDGAPAVHSRASVTGYSGDMLAAALMHRNGCDPSQLSVAVDSDGNIRRRNVPEAERVRVAEQSWQYAHCSMRDLLRMCARLDGVSVHEGMSPGAIFRALHTRAGGFSTNTFLNIYTTNIAAQLLTAYEQYPDTTGGGWVREADVQNFLTNERARMEKGPDLKKLPRQKEADHAEFSDNVETYKIARYARQFQIDEQDIVDDRFNGSIEHAPSEFGQAARRLRPDLVYAILMANPNMRDGTALFHADHNNLNTTATLAVATLATARKEMMLQTENSVNLNLVLAFLLVPPALEVTALELSKSPLLITGTDVIRPAMNALASSGFIVVPEPRLENGVTNPADSVTTAGSATTWFGAVRGNTAPTIEVGYLAGSGRSPQLRSGMLDRGRWGMWFDIKHDIGAKALDWRGFSKNTA